MSQYSTRKTIDLELVNIATRQLATYTYVQQHPRAPSSSLINLRAYLGARRQGSRRRAYAFIFDRAHAQYVYNTAKKIHQALIYFPLYVISTSWIDKHSEVVDIVGFLLPEVLPVLPPDWTLHDLPQSTPTALPQAVSNT